jgi:phosphotransferase system HPr (HPr) family protein
MVEMRATVTNAMGIHCRPAAEIVKAATGYSGRITVRASTGEADCRSIMGLLSLGLEQGADLTVTATGPEEEAMCTQLVKLFERHFDFPPRP